jgi:hypothetical protein
MTRRSFGWLLTSFGPDSKTCSEKFLVPGFWFLVKVFKLNRYKDEKGTSNQEPETRNFRGRV